RNTSARESTLDRRRTVSGIAGRGATLAQVHFHYGQRVKEGDPLLDIDTPSEEVARRAARVETIRAEERLHELADWESGSAMSGARRAVTRAQSALRDAERRAAETERLFGKGIVGGDERDAAKRELESVTLEAGAAEE